MDICLIRSEEGTKVIPSSIHGMLWLQTHFEEQHWDSIANKLVRIGNEEASELSEDAKEAGLIINSVPAVSLNLGNL